MFRPIKLMSLNNMKYSKAFLIVLLSISTSKLSFSQGRETLGNLQASAHQLCGENISIQITNTDDSFTLIGLKNKTTKKMDLFISDNPGEIGKSYSRFTPVVFDNLSKLFLKSDSADIDIIWGGAINEKKEINYQLALGNYTYDCAGIVAWPSDKANELYGEVAAGASTLKENAEVSTPVQDKSAKTKA